MHVVGLNQMLKLITNAIKINRKKVQGEANM